MANPFVWFHHGSARATESVAFYEALFGWTSLPGPSGGALLSVGGDSPFGGVGAPEASSDGWLPYVEVEDVDAAAEWATALGGKVVQARRQGPAGEFVVVRDPGAGMVALWRRST